jgi:Domain of unknown function (DU1801)
MNTESNVVEQYLENVQSTHKESIIKLRSVILKNLPVGFEETIGYGMIGYVVPKSIYADGYHCNPKLPLPYINLASQKNYISLHHIGLYACPEVFEWFLLEINNFSKKDLEMGKGCIKFKNLDKIPFDLIGKLIAKISVKEWIKMYEDKIKK